jgi:putative FmdB family regulatory protein
MLTYEYQCDVCGLRFEKKQAMSAPPLRECPECGGGVTRLITGGAGFLIKDSGSHQPARSQGDCSLENGGRTCCGSDDRCGTPPCGSGD